MNTQEFIGSGMDNLRERQSGYCVLRCETREITEHRRKVARSFWKGVAVTGLIAGVLFVCFCCRAEPSITPLNDQGLFASGIDAKCQPVPEPSVFALLFLVIWTGLASLIFCRKPKFTRTPGKEKEVNHGADATQKETNASSDGLNQPNEGAFCERQDAPQFQQFGS